MKASESKITDFISKADTRFVIPVYQRNYDWTHAQCKQLLNDILAVSKDDDVKSHFLGSIVYIHDGVYTSSEVKELVVIDGQQRLTTITLLYIALYNFAKDIGDERTRDKIQEQYLINKYADDSDKIKLKPAENNDKALKFLLHKHENDEFEQFSRLIENYNYFKENINEDNYQGILDGIQKLHFVEISLDRNNDNPQRIFESLNSTGLDLSEADLIRNYVLMKLERRDQERVYDTYWKYVEQNATNEDTRENKVSDFIRDFLTIKNNKIANKNAVYAEFKKKYQFDNDVEKLEDVLSELKNFSRLYNKLINPKNEKDNDISYQLILIKKLEINTSYPFLMRVYKDYEDKVISKEIFLSALEIVQSLTWKRFIVGLPTNGLNKIFMSLYDSVDQDDYLNSIQTALLKKKGTQKFPNNSEVFSALKDKDMYNIQAKNRSYFFEKFENFDNVEKVDVENNEKITVEHIFPQNPELTWKNNLNSEDYNFIKENYVNTIANLTLSGNNGKLSNKYFTEKRDMNKDGGEQGYKYSRLWLNRDLKDLESWGINEIENRFKSLSERFSKVWKYPTIKLEDIRDSSAEINIFDYKDPTNKVLEYVVFEDEKIVIDSYRSLLALIVKKLFSNKPEAFIDSKLKEILGISTNTENLRTSMKISDQYYIEGNLSAWDVFYRVREVLKKFDMEDDLLIKFEE